jgi:outer membrane protein
MLRRLSLALAVASAVSGTALAQEAPLAPRSDLVAVYQEAALNNADLAAARADFEARREVVPQARAGLLPNLSAGASATDTRSKVDTSAGNLTSSRSGLVYQASLSQPLFRADRWYQLQAAEAVSEQAALELSAAEQNLILRSTAK